MTIGVCILADNVLKKIYHGASPAIDTTFLLISFSGCLNFLDHNKSVLEFSRPVNRVGSPQDDQIKVKSK